MIEKLKKCSWLLVGLCLVMFLFGCDSSGGSDDDDDLTTDPYPSIVVEPYLPTTEFPGTVSAQYKKLELKYETIGGTKYVKKDLEVIYLFNDNTWGKTESKIYINASTGVKDDTKTVQVPEEKGSYTLTGDATNGSGTFTTTHDWENGTWVIDSDIDAFTITSGSLKEGTDTFKKF